MPALSRLYAGKRGPVLRGVPGGHPTGPSPRTQSRGWGGGRLSALALEVREIGYGAAGVSWWLRPVRYVRLATPWADGEDDQRLMEALKSGEASALGVLYDRYSGAVFGLCRRILGDSAEAEEASLDTFRQIWEQADRYDAGRARPLTWLLTIARSRSLDRVRARGRRRQVPMAPDDEQLLRALERNALPSAGALGRVLERELAERVRGVLARLGSSQREAVELSYYAGLSHAEIAERLETPLGTVKTRIRQGLVRMRAELRGEDGEEDS
jgi:RNA polymerase sigma-70 factor (ECF subfamily)